MQSRRIPSLRIGDLEVNPPIIQGGMGVRVSRANLAVAVADEGCIGVISAIGLGEFKKYPVSEFTRVNETALRQEIRKAKSLTDGIIGVNVMWALSDYENLSRAAVDEGVDVIFCGAGLPFDLPGILDGNSTKLVPIVSSARAFNLICRKWRARYGKVPDGVVVEGPKAGGHLGFEYGQLLSGDSPQLEGILADVIEIANLADPPIPVIAAGGIFDGSDIAHALRLGASGVQMGTRFVCTYECDVHEDFKLAYINARKEDITIIKSPVDMPGRVIKNRFVERVQRGERVPFKCTYKCLKNCDPRTSPYCIADVMMRAADGNFENAFAFCGANAYRCDEIVSVSELVERLAEETSTHLDD